MSATAVRPSSWQYMLQKLHSMAACDVQMRMNQSGWLARCMLRS